MKPYKENMYSHVLVEEISAILNEKDDEFIAKIARQVLGTKVKIVDDDVFEITRKQK